jgi:predicted branched-subunit amino acid permease
LDFAVPLTFIALVVPVLRERTGIAAAVVAGVVSVIAFSMPYQLSLVTATLFGIFAGVAVESFASQANDGRWTTIDD